MIVPVILAGGSGTRLWPLSRKRYPKQYMPLVEARTLFQSTLLRLAGLEERQSPIVLCNDEHRFIVAEQLRDLNMTHEAIVLEPVGRNTAPAIAVAAHLAVAKYEDAVLFVLPADHYIQDDQGFVRTVRQGLRHAQEDKMVTFGVVPTSPETGYGYIRKGSPLPMPADGAGPAAWQIDEFVEKPDVEKAKAYLSSGQYCWNSGIFLFKAHRLLKEMQAYAPDIVEACDRAVTKGHTDLDFFRLDRAAFQSCPSNSIDYAVMEKTEDGVMVALDSQWNDLGSWEALWQAGKKDDQRNVVHGDVCLQDVQDCFVHAASRLVAAVGLQHHVVVETKDAVFVAPRRHVQQVKILVNQLEQQNRIEIVNHKKAYRPWGSYEDVESADQYAIKRVTVKPKAKLSLQKHMYRAEHWVVLKGKALVTKGDEQLLLRADQSTYIPLGTLHRLENPGKTPLEVVEIQSGSYLGEDDIDRIENEYQRTNGPA